MLEQVRYENHLGESISFGSEGIYVDNNELHDYSWTYTAYNQRITSFTAGIATRTLPVVIACSSESEGVKLKNRLMECSLKDILAVEHGKLIVGDFYLRCYLTASKKRNYLYQQGYMEVSLTVTTDYPQWIRENPVYFRNGTEVSEGEKDSSTVIGSGRKRNFDYNYDFAYDYKNDYSVKPTENPAFIEGPFRLLIYGPCINPSIAIGGHIYQVNVTVPQGAILTIDSIDRRIYMTDASGNETNCFEFRNRDSYIFKPIPSGKLKIALVGALSFDLIMIEERSEPEWT